MRIYSDFLFLKGIEDDEFVECCDEEGDIRDFSKNSETCFPIKLEPDDTLGKSQTGQRRQCLNFVRSVGAPDLDCNPSPIQQSNQITHWLDASNVYGSNEDVTKRLRARRGARSRDGLLDVVFLNGKEQLPFNSLMDCEDSRGKQ